MGAYDCDPEGINLDINNAEFKLNDNYSFYIDKLKYGEPLLVGFCDTNVSECKILPQYQTDINDNLCVKINISSNLSWMVPNINESGKCVTLTGTNLQIGNYTKYGIKNHFFKEFIIDGVPNKINTNFYKLRLRLPNKKFVYFDKFIYGEAIYVAICDKSYNECYIIPKYRYDGTQDVCLEGEISNWKFSGFVLKETDSRLTCIQDADTYKYLSEYYKEGRLTFEQSCASCNPVQAEMKC